MKTIIIIKFCVALLLSYVPDGVRTERISNMLYEMAKEGDIIDWILKPSVNGSLNSRGPGTMYKAEFLPCNNMIVAMKVWASSEEKAARKEYRIYTYLYAIGNPEVEAYRIPSIYYYGLWNYSSHNYTIMAMTLLISPFRPKIDSFNQLTEADLLITFREFIRAIKYIHGKGIVNNNIYIEDMIRHKGQSFMFDFSESMDEIKATRIGYIIDAKEDFGRFRCSRFGGFSLFDMVEELPLNDPNYKENKQSGLGRVYKEFVKCVYPYGSENEIGYPFYDHLYRVINEEMGNAGEEATSSNPSLPPTPDEFTTFEWTHPPVIYGMFERMYSGYKTNARERSEKAEKAESSRSRLKWLKKNVPKPTKDKH